MKKGIIRLCLSLLLGGSYMLAPMSMVQVNAKQRSEYTKPIASYSMDAMTVMNRGSNHFEGNQEAIDKLANTDDFSMNANVKVTGADAVQAILFIGDNTLASNYISIYIAPNNTIGIEARDTAGSNVYNQKKVTEINFKDGNVHKVSYTHKKGGNYAFYVDGKMVLSGSVDVSFSKRIIPNANYLGIGAGSRANNGNNYLFTGEIGYVQLFDSVITDEQLQSYHKGVYEQQEVVYEGRNHYFTKGSTYQPLEDVDVTDFTSLNKGALSIRYRSSDANAGVMSLFSISDSKQASRYFSVYVNPGTNTIGVEIAGTHGNLPIFLGSSATINNTKWHTITITKNEAYEFYVDGVYINKYTRTGFMSDISTADSVNIGFVNRMNAASPMEFTGAIDQIKVYSSYLNEAEAKAEHILTYTPSQITDMTNAKKTEPQALFYPGYHDSSAYRIPSLLKTANGTMLAAIDKRNTGSPDNGNIDSILRRKELGDKDFQEPITIMDLVDNNNATPSAFLIDPSMVQDKETGRIFMLVDMFPESSGLMDTSILTTGTGYKKVNGVDYQKLFDASNAEYTIREKGIVYDADNQKSAYRVITECDAPYKELGNIYKNGRYVGNMYIFSGSNKGELHIARAQYLWLTYSDDDGKTWSLPKDITPQVKQDWMMFLGTGPGVGIQLQDGTLTFPVYSANANVNGSQASAVISSKDGGKTWKLGESPISLAGFDRSNMNSSGNILTESQMVQLNNGDVKLFMRNYSGKVKVATSTDGGMSWDNIDRISSINDVYCQLSATHYVKDGKEYIALLNPSISDRVNGTFYIGEVNGSDIHWMSSKMISPGSFAYSSIAATGIDEHGDETFSALYEGKDGNICYTEFDENYIKAGTIASTQAPPLVTDKSVTRNGDRLTIEITFDQIVMAANHPALNLLIGNSTLKAAYKTGSATNVITFEAQLTDQMFGMLQAKGVDETNGILENSMNDKTNISFDVLDLTQIPITNVTATSQHSNSTAENTDGAAVNVIDGNPNTYWHSKWGDSNITLPQSLTLDLGAVKNIYKFGYQPRQNSESGHVLDFELSVSNDEFGDYTNIYTGRFKNIYQEQFAEFAPVDARYIKFTVNSSTAGTSCSVAEVKAFAFAQGIYEDGDKQGLNDMIAKAQALLDDDNNYTIATKNVLSDVIVNAKHIMNGIASPNMIEHAILQLNKAIQNLVDASKLIDAIERAEALHPNDYTSVSWAIYQAAFEEMKETYHQITTSRGITDMIIRLDYEYEQLVRKEADKTLLQEYIDACQAMIATDYTKQSYQAFKSQLEAANDMLNQEVTQDEIDQMLASLKTSRAALISVVDLTATIAAAQKFNANDYTPESYQQLADALTAALKELENGSNESIATAIKDIQESIEQLVEVHDDMNTALLDFMINKGNEVMKQQAYYDTKANSWSTFKIALTYAKQLRYDMTSQELIDVAAKQLATAYEDIRLIANEETLAQLSAMIDRIEKLNLLAYHNADREMFLQVKNKLSTMVASSKFTMDEYEEALQWMYTAERRIQTGILKPVNSNLKQNGNITNVVTGDTTQQTVYVISMLAACMGAVMMLTLRKQKKHQ